MARTGQPPGGTAASDTGTGAAGSTGFRGAVEVVVAIVVVVVDVLVLLVAVGTAGCPPGTVVVVDATVVLDDGLAAVVLEVAMLLDEAEIVVVDALVVGVDELDVVLLTPSEFVVAVMAADVAVVTAAAGGPEVAVEVVVGLRAGGPSGMTVVAGVVSTVVGVGAGASAAMAGAAAMKAVAATEERERNNRLDIAAMIPAAQMPGLGWAQFARNCSFLVKRAVAECLYADLRPKRPVNEQPSGEFLGKPSLLEGT